MLASGIGSCFASPHDPARSRRSPLASARRTPSLTMSALMSQTMICRFAAAGARQLGDAKGDVARAAGHVEDVPARLRIEPFDHGVLPQPMDAGRHQIVHQVVIAARPRKRPRARGPPSRPRARRGSRNWQYVSAVMGGRIAAAELAMGYRHRSCRLLMVSSCPNCPKSKPSDGPSRPSWKAIDFTHVETRRGDLRMPFPNDFAKRADRPQGQAALAPREISAGRARQRRNPGHPSGHERAHERSMPKARNASSGNMSMTPRRPMRATASTIMW